MLTSSSCARVYRAHDLVVTAQILPSLQPLMDQRLFDSAFNDFRFTFCELRYHPVSVWRIRGSLTDYILVPKGYNISPLYAVFPLNNCRLCFSFREKIDTTFHLDSHCFIKKKFYVIFLNSFYIIWCSKVQQCKPNYYLFSSITINNLNAIFSPKTITVYTLLHDNVKYSFKINQSIFVLKQIPK